MASISGTIDRNFKPIELAPLRGLPIYLELKKRSRQPGTKKSVTSIVGVLEGLVVSDDSFDFTLEFKFFGKSYEIHPGDEYEITAL